MRKINKRPNGPRKISNELPNGYIKKSDGIYKILDDGSYKKCVMVEIPFSEFIGEDLDNENRN